MARDCLNSELPVISELCVMLVAIKEMNLVACLRGIDHSLLGVMVVGAVPIEDATAECIVILLVVVALVAGAEQNDFVVVGWGDDASGNRLESGIAPKLGESVAGVSAVQVDSVERDMGHNRELVVACLAFVTRDA